jgi:pyrroline-5-carboxylate reductase
MRIAFIGGGNMATALIGGLLRDAMAPASIHVVEVDPQRLAALRQKFGIDGSSAPDDGLRGTDATVFAVKPQQMREACTQCRPWLDGGFALTIAAGIPAASVAAWSGRPQVVRAMPNTPALIGAGITGMSAGAVLAPAARALAERIMSAAGEVVWFDDEAMLDAVTAVSGSGPAYVFFFIASSRPCRRPDRRWA